MSKCRRDLTINLECQYGLMDILISRDIFMDEELSSIKALQSDYIKQNDKLIELLCLRKDVMKYEYFLDALMETHQSHLAGCIAANAGEVFVRFDSHSMWRIDLQQQARALRGAFWLQRKLSNFGFIWPFIL